MTLDLGHVESSLYVLVYNYSRLRSSMFTTYITLMSYLSSWAATVTTTT